MVRVDYSADDTGFGSSLLSMEGDKCPLVDGRSHDPGASDGPLVDWCWSVRFEGVSGCGEEESCALGRELALTLAEFGLAPTTI